jgi:sugar lactone lactonase YvrE
LEEDLRLGTALADGPAAEQFGEIASVRADREGRIYVLDAQAQEIRVFDATGTYSHSIGRRGEGPGEFTYASEVDVGPAGDIWVLDDGMLRYSVFGADGALQRVHPRAIIGHYSAFRGAVLEDGSYVDWDLTFPDGRFGSRSSFRPLRFQPGLESHDSLPPLEYRWEMLPSGRMPLRYFNPFPLAAIDRAGSVWFADSRRYEVFRRSLRGDTTLVFTLPAEARRVSPEDRDSVGNQRFRTDGRRREVVGALREKKPIVYGIVPDNAGHLLLFVDLEGEPTGSVVDVFEDTGSYLGRLHLPFRVGLSSRGPPPVHATADYLYLTGRDELGAPYVSRLRVVRGL